VKNVKINILFFTVYEILVLRKQLRFPDCDRLRFGDSRGEGSESPELERADATRRTREQTKSATWTGCALFIYGRRCGGPARGLVASAGVFIRRSLRFPGSRGCTWSLLVPVHSSPLPRLLPTLFLFHRRSLFRILASRDPRHGHAPVNLNRSMEIRPWRIGSIARHPAVGAPACRSGDLSAFLGSWISTRAERTF